MKIVLSPSKTQSILRYPVPCAPALLHPEKTLKIMRSMQRYSRDRLGLLLELHGHLLNETYATIQNWTLEGALPAIDLYTGVTFDGLHQLDRNSVAWQYAIDHVRIFSALYGVLSPCMCVAPYRLDFTVRLWSTSSLITYWKKVVQSYFKDEDWILDCASVEFSKLLDGIQVPIHKVDFMDEDANGTRKIISYNAKKMRGLLVAWCAERQLQSPTELPQFQREGYVYDQTESTSSYSVFIRPYTKRSTPQ